MTESLPKQQQKEDGNPLPLVDLQRCLLMDDDTNHLYAWLQEADRKAAAFQQELQENQHENLAKLFGHADSDDSDDEDHNDNKYRVQVWTSSRTNVDGRGGFEQRRQDDHEIAEQEEGSARVLYILSQSWEGFGHQVWSSARHAANLLADPIRCREFFLYRSEETTELSSENHPLVGKRVVELGAGCGIPSWTAMRCGARVVCTDLAVADRVRCMAECVERNYREMKEELVAEEDIVLQCAAQAKACPHDWGSPVQQVLQSLNPSGKERFDLVIAADCCYMPWLHSDLLDSIHNLLSDEGVALIAFALHGNTDDDDVWGIVELARDQKGFRVEVMESVQLTPQKAAMESKQGLVHTVRLTKNQVNRNQ